MAAKDYVRRYDKVIFCTWFDALYLILLWHLWYLARVSLFTITDYSKTIYIRFNRELINGEQRITINRLTLQETLRKGENRICPDMM